MVRTRLALVVSEPCHTSCSQITVPRGLYCYLNITAMLARLTHNVPRLTVPPTNAMFHESGSIASRSEITATEMRRITNIRRGETTLSRPRLNPKP